MNRRIWMSVLLFSLQGFSVAATDNLVWDTASKALGKYQIQPQKNSASLIPQQQSIYTLKPIKSGPENIRYQVYFKNIPVWGYELIIHHKHQADPLVTGMDVAGIEKDIISVKASLSAKEVEKQIKDSLDAEVAFIQANKIVFIDKNKKAQLAYHVVSYTHSDKVPLASPNFIVDAHTGTIISQWNDLHQEKIGQGLGGNVFALPYREGVFQHGDAHLGFKQLGKFEVTTRDGRCYLETPEIRLVNAAETNLTRSSFPLLNIVEIFKYIPTFSYPCNESSEYINYNDNDTAPANYSFSSVNDTMYFATVTIEMYKELYGLKQPLGDDLPLRAYTHIKHFDNAFAVPSVKYKGFYLIHQQIVIGDGDVMFTAPAQSALAHELSHNVTRLHSNLVYKEQSGGINESFSDMAAIAMQDYLRTKYPWYWDGKDWSVGRDATIGAGAMRYMDNPTLDKHSIDNANDYFDGIDVHYTSGVFNKAFYLLATSKNWSVQKAFQVMLDANVNYWTSNTHFEAAACGVIQAAKDRGYEKETVIHAFSEVGIACPIQSIVAV